MEQTILIIDDEAHVRMLFAEELRRIGYRVQDIDGSGDAVAQVAEYAPDLIILDIKLGAKSGLDVLQDIRLRHAAVPVILCTAYDSFRFDMKSIAADAYIVKSYDSANLIAKVKELLPLRTG